MDVFKDVLECTGTMAEFARRLSVTPQAVSKWRKSGRIPAERVLEIERATGISLTKLRPDLYS